MYKITLVTEDDRAITFEASATENIIASALKRKIILLSSCKEGGCATCKAKCSDGEYELLNCSVQALPPDEEDDGFVLLCQTYPRSNLTLNLPYTFDRISLGKVKTDWQGDILHVEKIASNVVRLMIRPVDPASGSPIKLPFTPGQFCDIEVPGTNVWRPFSMASVPESSTLEFLIRLQPGGFFSNFLRTAARPGMRVRLNGPSGLFALHENGLRPRCFVAGGTGLSPILSLIRSTHAEGHPHETTLFFGVTHEHELFCMDALRELAASMPNLDVHICVVHAKAAGGHVSGSVVEELARHLQDARHTPDLYLCGPPGMIDTALAAARQYGLSTDTVFFEKFLPACKVKVAG